MHKLFKHTKTQEIDITEFIGKITRRSNKKEISEEVSFEIAYSDKNIGKNFLDIGDIIYLRNEFKELWRGIIIDETVTERKSKSYKAFDYGWYLNKNEEIYQFNNTVSENIKKICKDFDIPVNVIIDIPTQFNKITRGNLKEIISKMLELAEKEQGKKYIWQMIENKFNLIEREDNVVWYDTNMFGLNTDITQTISSPTHKRTIENMKNAIKVVTQEDNEATTLAYNEDRDSIAKYGRLQKIEQLSKDDKDKATSIANNYLKNINLIEHDISIELPGYDDMRANKVLQLNEPVTGIIGKFLVSDCVHEITSTSHTMKLGLEVL